MVENGKIAVEKRDFSTLSTELSTRVVHSVYNCRICILVDISFFDPVRQTSYFFAIYHFAILLFGVAKKGLDKAISLGKLPTA